MNTISFSNAFKSLMATLGAKTTDSNYAVPLVDKTSGAPAGFMDMSNLASVLGVNVYTFNLAPCATSAQFSGIGVWSVTESARKGAAALFAICFDSGANGSYIINDDKSVFTDYIQINKTTQGYDFTITNKHATNTVGIVLRKVS